EAGPEATTRRHRYLVPKLRMPRDLLLQCSINPGAVTSRLAALGPLVGANEHVNLEPRQLSPAALGSEHGVVDHLLLLGGILPPLLLLGRQGVDGVEVQKV